MAKELTQLDRDYSPSMWSRRNLSSDDVITDHVTRTELETDKARRDLFCVLNVRYGRTEKNIMDFYSQTSIVRSDSSLVVYVHGGYWDALSSKESAYLAPTLCSQFPDCIFIAVDYVLASERQFGLEASMTGICRGMEDVLRAVNAVARTFCCSGINFVGHSAGAHLVASMLSEVYSNEARNDLFDRLKSVWLLSGIYDLEPISLTYVNDPLQLTRTEIELFSPKNHVAECAKNLAHSPGCSVHIAYGEDDPPPFHEQSCQYYKALKDAIETDIVLPVPVKVAERDHFDLMDNLLDNYALQGLQSALKEDDLARSARGASNMSRFNLRDYDIEHIIQSLMDGSDEVK